MLQGGSAASIAVITTAAIGVTIRKSAVDTDTLLHAALTAAQRSSANSSLRCDCSRLQRQSLNSLRVAVQSVQAFLLLSQQSASERSPALHYSYSSY
eukprot:12733-Heterococcus_DN1.PRE.4